jgi:hypothetical protein
VKATARSRLAFAARFLYGVVEFDGNRTGGLSLNSVAFVAVAEQRGRDQSLQNLPESEDSRQECRRQA